MGKTGILSHNYWVRKSAGDSKFMILRTIAIKTRNLASNN